MIFELWIFPPVLCVGKRSELGAEVSLQSSQIRTWLSPPIKQSMPQAGYLLAQHFYCAPLCICHCGPWKCRATVQPLEAPCVDIFSSLAPPSCLSGCLWWFKLSVRDRLSAKGAWQNKRCPFSVFTLPLRELIWWGLPQTQTEIGGLKFFFKKDKFQHTIIWIKLFSCCNYSFPH